MSDLTELESFDCLRTNLRSAAQNCVNLAKLPAQGPTYRKLIDELRLIEGSARQIAAFRFDMRWSQFGYEMARFHDRIGECIRSRAARKIFLEMAKMMRAKLVEADKLRTAKTGKLGPILPKVQPLHRENRPVYFQNPSGLIIPASALN